jgi:hypothetical protein
LVSVAVIETEENLVAVQVMAVGLVYFEPVFCLRLMALSSLLDTATHAWFLGT